MKVYLIGLFLILIPLVFGIECQRVMEPREIPCVIYSSWEPAEGCNATMTFYDTTNGTVLNTTWEDTVPYCQTTFNITTEGIYQGTSSIEDVVITIESEDNMTSLGVIIFLLIINGVLFYLPMKIRFSNRKPTDFLIRNFVWVLAWVVMTLNITILVTLADNAGLGITSELFLFQWFGLKGIYILAIIIFIRTMTMVPKLLKEEKIAKRMGKDEG